MAASARPFDSDAIARYVRTGMAPVVC